MLALCLLGFAILLMNRRRRLRASMFALVMMLAVSLLGCSGSSGGALAPNASTQEVASMDIIEGGSQPVGVSGLPADLGKIRKE